MAVKRMDCRSFLSWRLRVHRFAIWRLAVRCFTMVQLLTIALREQILGFPDWEVGIANSSICIVKSGQTCNQTDHLSRAFGDDA